MSEHFRLETTGRIARVSLDRPERKNPLTFESYAALRDWFRALPYSDDIDVVVFGSNGGSFSSGGDVHDIIGPLVSSDMAGLLRFTRLTGDLVKAMRACPQPIVAAVDGTCAGAGAIIAMASDMRYGTGQSKIAFLFERWGSRAATWGRATSSRASSARGGHPSSSTPDGRWMAAKPKLGILQPVRAARRSSAKRRRWPRAIAVRPDFRARDDKAQLHQEWIDGHDHAIESEAQAQAICMETHDYERAYKAFVAKQRPVFEGD